MWRALILSAVLATPPVASCAAPPGANEIVPPAAAPQTPAPNTWLRAPTNVDVDKVYPVDAKLSYIWGRVVLRCSVAADGRLRGCTVASETPADWGFGKAALELAPLFQENVTPAGYPDDVGTVISLPIGFAIPEHCANCVKNPRH